MTETQLAELSRDLFFPWTFLLYIGSMLAYFYRMAFGQVDADTTAPTRGSRTAGVLAVGLGVAGLGTHLASIVLRSVGSGVRVPLGNMYEYSSVMGFGVVLIALGLVHLRFKRPELVGFLLLGALVTMGGALVLYTPAGPLMPALQSHWLKIHTFAIMVSATIFTVAFVLTGLYLIRDEAERRVAHLIDASQVGSTVGAAYAPPTADDPIEDHVDEDAGALPDEDAGALSDQDDVAYGRALRRAVNPVPMVLSAASLTTAYALLFRNPTAVVVAPLVVALGVLAAWALLPKLPSAATLDALAYRTTAFSFPIWTFAVIAGAIWAEQSWGRYWGWDPKETGAFLTWVAYAGYLHSRATRGLRGRRAAGIGVLAFLMLMFTYYAVNLWVTGLHSYADAEAGAPSYAGIAGALAVYGGVQLWRRRGQGSTAA